MNKEVDLTNKVILDLDKYIEIREERKDILNEVIKYKDKYENLVRYLLSECAIVHYSSGKCAMEFEKYNNHLAEYIQSIEPDLYEERLENLKLGDSNEK